MAFSNFYGKPGEVAPDFLDNLEMAFLVSRRDDEATKLRAFPLVLREGAKAWYQTLAPEERRDWETLKTAFIEEFRHQEPPEEIWRQLMELRQTSPNDYRSYEGKFSNLWEKWCASLGEGERAPKCLKKDCFLAGLYPILQEKVKVKFLDTFEKAMAYAREKDRKLKFQAQLQGGMEPPPLTQPIARAVAGTSATDQESSQQELLQQITNQLESLSINLVQGVRAPQSGNDCNCQEGQRQTREYVCYNCGEVGHGMYFCPHPRRYQGNGNHRRAPHQQVTPPRARPPNGQQNAPVAPPIQILRPPPPPPQTPAEIPPLPSGGEDRVVSVISLDNGKDKGKEKMEKAVAMPIKRVRRQKSDEMEASEPEKGHEGSSQVIGDKKRKSRSRRHIGVEDFPLGVGSTPYDLISDSHTTSQRYKSGISGAQLPRKDGMMRVPADSPAWKHIETQWSEFGLEPRHLRLGLASDGVNPFDTKSTSWSTRLVVIVNNNIPPWGTTKKGNVLLSLLVPGNYKVANIDVYLEPLIEELEELWRGISVVDVPLPSRRREVRVKGILMWTMHDYPELGEISGAFFYYCS
ncbi:hypothetical protein L7F22_023045 [Adiantum nelumboides]|nr:hypothetical protein [Adiantum nelumboides]